LCNGLSVFYFWRRSVVSWQILTLGIAHGHRVMHMRTSHRGGECGRARKCQRLASSLQRPGIARRSYFEAQLCSPFDITASWPPRPGDNSTIIDYSRWPPSVARTITSLLGAIPSHNIISLQTYNCHTNMRAASSMDPLHATHFDRLCVTHHLLLPPNYCAFCMTFQILSGKSLGCSGPCAANYPSSQG
jgi:hypothetical protein